MKYTEGRLGRIFAVRLEDGESIYQAVESVCAKEDVKCAAVMAIGGIRSSKVVTGPENKRGKIIPHFEHIDDCHELVGVGTVFPQDGKPSLHFHTGIGRRDKALVGCPRAAMSVYLILEVVIIELVGIAASREFDPQLGVHLLTIASGQRRMN